MDKYLDAALDEVGGLLIAIALATIAVFLGLLFFVVWQIYVYWQHQERVKKAEVDAKRIQLEEAVTYNVDDILKATWPNMSYATKQAEGTPGL